jgi:microcystin-dependent protein
MRTVVVPCQEIIVMLRCDITLYFSNPFADIIDIDASSELDWLNLALRIQYSDSLRCVMPLVPFVGQIMPAGFGIIPKGWARCDGSLLSIQQNQALFSLIGTTYGGDGLRIFALPDLRGRAVLGSNLASVPWGVIEGTESVTLSVQNLPAHNHTVGATSKSGSGRSVVPTNRIFAAATGNEMIFAPARSNEVPLASGTNIGNTGGNAPHNNMQPYLVVNYLIALSGVFPPRP